MDPKRMTLHFLRLKDICHFRRLYIPLKVLLEEKERKESNCGLRKEEKDKEEVSRED